MARFRFALICLFLISCAQVEKKDAYTRYQDASVSGKDCGKLLSRLPKQSGSTWNEDSKSQVEKAFIGCLEEYSKIDTHSASLQFLKAALERLDVPYKQTSDKDTSRLIAHVDSSVKGAESVLMVHPTMLSNGQLVAQDGKTDYMWGQQKTDIKSIGIMQLMALTFAKKSNKPFKKNLVLVATADGHFKDALQMFPRAEVILNEGGMGFTKQDKAVFLIGSEQKGGAWLKFKHPSPSRLMSHMDQLMAVFLPHEPQDFKEPGRCRIVSFTTHDQKVNAIPYKVDLELNCKGVSELLVGQAFAHQDVTFLGKRIGDSYFVSIELNQSYNNTNLGRLSALQVAAQGLQKLSVIPYRDWSFEEPQFYKHVRTPASADFVKNVKTVYSSASPWGDLLWELDSSGEWSRVRSDLSPDKLDGPEKMFRTSCHWTGFDSHAQGSEAYVDCRLIHTGFVKNNGGSHADLFIQQLKALAKDNQLQIEVVKGWDYKASDNKSQFVNIMKQEILKEFPKASTSTWLAPVSTALEAPDKKKIPSYGFYPVLREDFIEGGKDQFPLQQAFSANRIYSGTVSRLAN